jgi:hypothetical protein
MLMGLLRNVPGNPARREWVARQKPQNSADRSNLRTEGRISKMFDANGLHHYWDSSLAHFKEENDVDI